jgi:hypothetical protein
LNVLWVAYATHSTLKPVPTLPRGVRVTPQLLFTPWEDTVPTVQVAGWAPELVWTGAENLAPTGIQSPERPAHSQSLYRLRYPAHLWNHAYLIFQHLMQDIKHSDRNASGHISDSRCIILTQA